MIEIIANIIGTILGMAFTIIDFAFIIALLNPKFRNKLFMLIEKYAMQ